MNRNLVIGFLGLALIVAASFAFFQSQNLTNLQSTSTQVLANLRGTGTISAENAIGTSTQAANFAFGTSTQAAENAIATGTSLADSNFSTSTQSALEFNNAAATSTRAALVNNAQGQRIIATSTQSANNAIATGTSLADSANATSTQSANHAATQASIGTESAQIADSTATAARNLQATLESQNIVYLSTLEASGWIGEGIFGESSILLDGYELFTGEGYEIALADSFEGADLRDNPRSLFRALDGLGFDSTSDYLREQDENFLFFAFDNQLINTIPRATVSIVRDTPSIETSLEGYLDGAYIGLQGSTAVIISELVPINGQAAARGILEQQFSNGAVLQVQYVFKVESSFYVITFTLLESAYGEMRPIIEQSVASFRLRND